MAKLVLGMQRFTVPEHLHPYWCFHDELTILDGLIMKGNRVVIPTSMRPATLNRLLDAHQGLTSMLQRARRNVYQPKLQDDITEMVHKCDDCQRHGNKKPRTQERQISATRPVEILGMDLVDFCVASTPGQNVHLVLPHNHVVVSSSHLAKSSSQLVLSSSLSQSAVELSRCAITRLFFNSSYYLSTRHVAFQLFVQRSRALFLEKEGT